MTFPVDVHSTDPTKNKDYDHRGVQAQPYDIPLRAMIARDVDGLLLAGRCIKSACPMDNPGSPGEPSSVSASAQDSALRLREVRTGVVSRKRHDPGHPRVY